jgi:hypothetical protein
VLTWIPEEAWDRLSSIFGIWYISEQVWYTMGLIWIPEEVLDRFSLTIFYANKQISMGHTTLAHKDNREGRR